MAHKFFLKMVFFASFSLFAFTTFTSEAVENTNGQTENPKYSFEDVRRQVYENPYRLEDDKLPVYTGFSPKILIKSFVDTFSASAARFFEKITGYGDNETYLNETYLIDRARKTVGRNDDFIIARPKVLHPMGVCAEAQWKIDTNTVATGLLANGTDIPAIVRMSIATDQVNYDPKSSRVIAIAVKLFPTTNKNEPVKTRNFLTTDQAGLDGSFRHSFFFPNTDGDESVHFTNAAKGNGIVAKAGFFLFDIIDGPSDYRPLYQVAEVDSNNHAIQQAIYPSVLHLVPHFKNKLNTAPLDFREEILSYHSGELVFDIVIPPQEGVDKSTVIGSLTLGEPVASFNCDQRLHFQHHPMNRSLDESATQKPDLRMNGTLREKVHRYRNQKFDTVSSNGWEYLTNNLAKDMGSGIPFHEVKYFNYTSENSTGAITYLLASPNYAMPVLDINAHFLVNNKMTTFHHTMTLRCVTANPEQADIDLCHRGGIKVENNGSLRSFQNQGDIRWDLLYSADENQRTNRITHIKLDKFFYGLERLIPELKGNFFWVPVMGTARVTGWIEIGNEVVNVNSELGYHDQHWGVWNPSLEPLRWAHFNGEDSGNQKVEVSLAEFPKNSDKSIGLTLNIDGKKYFWPQGTYSVNLRNKGTIPLAVFPRVGFDQFAVDPSFKTGTHPIDRQLTVHARGLNGISELNIDIDTIAGTAVTKKGSEPALDEQIVKFSVKYKLNDVVRTAQGTGFFMKTTSNNDQYNNR